MTLSPKIIVRGKTKVTVLLMVKGFMSGQGEVSRHLELATEAASRKQHFFKFQQDGASCHRAKRIMNWLRVRNIPVLTWSVNSSDLSQIQTLWGKVEKELKTNLDNR